MRYDIQPPVLRFCYRKNPTFLFTEENRMFSAPSTLSPAPFC